MPSQPTAGRIIVLNSLTLGLYFFYWADRSRKAINQSAKQILVPPAWYLAIPLVRIWWAWQYAGALEYVSFRRLRSGDVFLLYVIAINAWLILPFGNLLNVFLPEIRTVRDAVITGAVLTGSFVIITLIGTTAFMVIMQRKITALQN